MVYNFFRNGKSTPKLCPDGMVFNDYDSNVEKCDLPFNLDCSKKPKLRKLSKPIENITIIKII